MSQKPVTWNERYQTEAFYYGTEANDYLKSQVSSIKAGGRVLCLAEGEGRNAVYLAKQGFQVFAVDGSSVGLEKAKKLAQSQGVEIETEVCDLAEFQIEPGSFDGVVSIWCHLPKAIRQVLHQKCVSGLRPGGVLILEAYRPEQLEYKTGGPPTADWMMTLSDLKEELRGLELLTFQELDRDISEGIGHQGMSAVVQVLGKKIR
jgi:SAM-dependent methyltransferase